jgi:hypothetical protein
MAPMAGLEPAHGDFLTVAARTYGIGFELDEPAFSDEPVMVWCQQRRNVRRHRDAQHEIRVFLFRRTDRVETAAAPLAVLQRATQSEGDSLNLESFRPSDTLEIFRERLREREPIRFASFRQRPAVGVTTAFERTEFSGKVETS